MSFVAASHGYDDKLQCVLQMHKVIFSSERKNVNNEARKPRNASESSPVLHAHTWR